jgi:hypothetical protein
MEPESSMRRMVSKVVRKAYGSSPLVWMVAGIDTAGVAGEYDDEEGTANSDGRAPRVGPEAAFGEGVYAGGGSFMPGWEGFVRGA